MVYAGVRLPGAHMSTADKKTLGIGASKLSSKHRRVMHRNDDPQQLLTPDAVLAMLERGMCPMCDRGPFQVVLAHLGKSHGWGGDEVRQYVAVSQNHVFTAPEHHVRVAARAKARGLPDGATHKAVAQRAERGRRKTAALTSAAQRAVRIAHAKQVASAAARKAKMLDEWEASGQTWADLHAIADRHEMTAKSFREVLLGNGVVVEDGRAASPKRLRPRPLRICSIEGCTRRHTARGLCRYHWREDRISRGIYTPCSADDCAKPVVGNGLCSMHYAASRRN